ncbi:MAG: class I SAM-dependent methyltransferase [Alphaproteobacteria bacterium]
MKLNIKLVYVALLVAGATSGWTMEDSDKPEQTITSARTANAKSVINPIAAKVRDVIFRRHPGSHLLQEKIAFQRRYPKECKLIDHDYFDRGFNMSFLDPFFVLAMNFTEQLISRNLGRAIIVCDFGCGIGHTSILLGLLGSREQIHVLGIENGMKADEFEETKAFHAYAERLHGQLGFVGGLPVRLKTDVEATTLQGYSTYAPSNVFDVNFMGNFLHMFDPKAAKKLVEEHAHRMLRPGRMVLASVDGICAAGNNIEKAKEVYLQAKQEGKKFPSVINILDLAIGTVNKLDF